MANVRNKSSRRGAKRMTLTAAFMTDAATLPPKGAASVTFQAHRTAIEVLSARPAKVKALIRGYGEAIAKSRKEGRAVSFKVEVDPTGGAKVTPIGDGTMASAPPDEESVDTLNAELEEARGRGRARAAQILAGEDMLSADQFANLIGTSRMTVNTKRKNHQVLGLGGAKRGFRFPAWQVGDDGKPFAALPRLFDRLGGGDWSVYRFLVEAHPELDGLTGREALSRGESERALAVADEIAQGAFA
jgi:hypothetical protein